MGTFKAAAILLLAFALVGCQSAVGPYISAPNLNPPDVVVTNAPSPTPTPTPHPNPTANPTGHFVPREWIPTAPAHAWKWIVIHHSDTATGSATAFDNYHRNVRHWDELGYHFVIGNGTLSGDGQVEVGSRWPKQKWGAHAGVEQYNEFGIGICLVGDFDKTTPSRAQLESLAKLVAYLMHSYHIPADRVVGHRDVRKTRCPGHNLSIETVRQKALALLKSGYPNTKPLIPVR